MIEVNRPKCPFMHPTQVDGPGVQTAAWNNMNLPNYFPNSYSNIGTHRAFLPHTEPVTGDVTRHESGNEDNFSQASVFWAKVLKPDEQQRLVENIAGHASGAEKQIQERVIELFGNVHPNFGEKLRAALSRNAMGKL